MILKNWKSGEAISAKNMQDMTDAIRTNTAGSPQSILGGFVGEPALGVQIYNGLGREVALGEVVGLGEQKTTGNLMQRVINIEEIDLTDHRDAFAIVGKQFNDKNISTGYISGLCLARINIEDADHGYAEMKASETFLQSVGFGMVKIIWKETGTGEVWAVVRLGHNPGVITVTAQADESDGEISVKLTESDGTEIGSAFDVVNGDT